ncbi:MAG: tRNA lysidine(34) synthetase TilS [Clostridia bacterium]|nr:tRNA lysidine(34) synthetase TilS [Clostridia bacterium]
MIPIDVTRFDLFRKVQQAVADSHMLSDGDSVLVGLSGGADSVALLRILLALKEQYHLSVSCAHVNHRLRGDAAKRDMQFVTNLCKKTEVPLAVLEEDVKDYALRYHLSLEEAGRAVRYRFFTEQKTDKIAVAHTKNDNAETVFMNLVKGNLPMGIPQKREQIIRPLLGITKEELVSFLAEIGQDYVTDETNFSKEYLRNRIRLEAIPYLEENFNKNFTQTVYNTSDILWQEQDYLEGMVSEFLKTHATIQAQRIQISKKAVAEAHVAIARKVIRRCYYLLAGEKGHISYEQIHRLLALCKSGQSGQKIELPSKVEGALCNDWLMFSRKQEETSYTYPLSFGEWVDVPEWDCAFCLAKEMPEDCDYSYPMVVSSGDSVWVRNRKNGDKIYFSNQNIHKKVSDFLSEKKVPLWDRNRIPLVLVNDDIRVITGYFWESIPKKANNIIHVLIKFKRKGN